MLQVTTVGHALVDVLSDTTDDYVEGLGAVKGTMTLVDDETARAVQSGLVPGKLASGGSAANTAVCLASLGARVEFIGKVADDEHGRVFVDDIRAAGVRYGLAPAPAGGAPTGTCTILVTPDAEKTMFTNLGIGASLTLDDVAEAGGAEVTYIEGYLLGGPGASTAREAARRTRDTGATVALSASDPALVQGLRAELLEFAAGCDLLFANEDEARGLVPEASSVDAAAEWLQRHLAGDRATVAVTLGADGCLVWGPDGPVRLPAEPVESVVDTTGAGDSFAAGYLYGWVHGLGPEVSGRIGGIAAAHIVTHLGARPLTDLAALARAAGLIG